MTLLIGIAERPRLPSTVVDAVHCTESYVAPAVRALQDWAKAPAIDGCDESPPTSPARLQHIRSGAETRLLRSLRVVRTAACSKPWGCLRMDNSTLRRRYRSTSLQAFYGVRVLSGIIRHYASNIQRDEAAAVMRPAAGVRSTQPRLADQLHGPGSAGAVLGRLGRTRRTSHRRTHCRPCSKQTSRYHWTTIIHATMKNHPNYSTPLRRRLSPWQ